MARTSTENKLAYRAPTLEIIFSEARKFFPNDPKGQASYFFDKYRIPASQGRVRSVSVATTRKYVYSVHALLNTLSSLNINITDLKDLTFRQCRLAFRKFEEDGLSSSSISTYFSCLKRFYSWLEKPFPARSVSEVLENSESGKRQKTATTPKSWTSKGVDFHSVLQSLEAIDTYSAIYLRLNLAFGLRVQESVALKPFDSDKSSYLVVILGAKGGRGRTVPYTNDFQREAIALAKQLAKKRNGLLRPAGLTLQQAISRYYYHLKKVGVCKSVLGVTAHGLRHEYANNVYKEITGHDSPVHPGINAQLHVDHEARDEITERLGHSRRSITAAYLGTIQYMSRERRRHLNALTTSLCGDGALRKACHAIAHHHAEQSSASVELRIYVNGPEAAGTITQGTPLLLSAGAFNLQTQMPIKLLTLDDLARIEEAARQDVGRRCIVQADDKVPAHEDRFELLLPVPRN